MPALGALILALASAAAVDRLAARRGLDPPGFRDPQRRLLAGLGLAFVLYLGVFFPALSFGQVAEVDFEQVGVLQIFFFQLLLLAFLAAWCALGFGAPGAGEAGQPDEASGELSAPVEDPRGRPSGGWIGGLGLTARRVGTELSIGLVWGLVGWLVVISAALALGLAVVELGGDDALGRSPAAQIVWLASLPVALRLAVSVAAGVAEELFFRGFLQPRIGIGASTALFVAAHAGYGQLFMLFGICLLSLFYAWLARWRRSVWAAMAAHFLFDAIQLLVIIPVALKAYETAAT